MIWGDGFGHSHAQLTPKHTVGSYWVLLVFEECCRKRDRSQIGDNPESLGVAFDVVEQQHRSPSLTVHLGQDSQFQMGIRPIHMFELSEFVNLF